MRAEDLYLLAAGADVPFTATPDPASGTKARDRPAHLSLRRAGIRTSRAGNIRASGAGARMGCLIRRVP